MKKKKNRFLLFWWSLIPGAGELYLGFMKMGVSILSVFALVMMFTIYTNIGVSAFAVFVIWLYGFFHANNLGALSDEEFYRMEDVYLFGIKEDGPDSVKDCIMGKYRIGFAAILIILGVSMLWQTFCGFLRRIMGNGFYDMYIYKITSTISNEMPRMLIGIVVIWIGVKLIMGKKAELDRMEEKDERTGQQTETGAWREGSAEQARDAGQTGSAAQTRDAGQTGMDR